MTTKNHFLISYAGNKRQEYKEIKNILPFDKNIKNIVEPFCGSSATSYNIWKEHGNKFNYYLNDKDKKLMEIYDLMKMESKANIEEKINQIKKELQNYKNEFLYRFKNQRDIYDYIYFNRYYGIRPGLYNDKRVSTKNDFEISKECLNFMEFLRCPNVFITCDDWSIIFNEHKNNEHSIIILDPPYIGSCNDFYKNDDCSIYEYFLKDEIKQSKAYIFIWLNQNWIIKLLFRHWYFLHEYDKTYGMTKRKTLHTIISNKKLTDIL